MPLTLATPGIDVRRAGAERSSVCRIEKRDRLSLSVPADSLWSGYDLPDNRIGWEYRGCYYLLGKDLDAFCPFLGGDTFLGQGEPNAQAFPGSRIVAGGQGPYLGLSVLFRYSRS